MGRTIIGLTNWNDVHVLDMPPAEMTYEERGSRIPPGHLLWGRIPNPEVAMGEGRSLQGGKKMCAILVQVCPGFAYSPVGLLEDSHSCGYSPGTLTHLIELFRKHRRAFMKFTRVYAVGGASSDGPGQPLMLPYIGVSGKGSVTPTLGTLELRDGGHERIFNRSPERGSEAFIFLEDSSHLDVLFCSVCLGK